MKKLTTLFLLLFATNALCQSMSYWAQGFNRQGNAKYAQQYFATNGPGIAFSFDGVHWVISATGTNVAGATNAIYAQYATNWLGSNALYLLLSGMIANIPPQQTNWPASSITNAPWLTNTVGLSVTQQVVLWGTNLANQFTFTNVYANGLLVASGQFIPAHGASLILPGGGYLLQPNGGSILLP